MIVFNSTRYFRKSHQKRWSLLSLIAATMLGASLKVSADTRDVVDFNIKPQSVAAALVDFGVQGGVTVGFSDDVVNGYNTAGISGLYPVVEALERLLNKTDLSFRIVDNKTISVGKESSVSDGEGIDAKSTEREVIKNQEHKIEDILVTASKRGSGTSIQNTAMSITAMETDELEKKSIVSMADYLSFVPSVTYLNYGTTWNQVVIRGVGVNFVDQATVNTYFGEVPLTLPFSLGISSDLKLVDMERVEVLRGPQGTLYGSSSMGGTIRNIPVAPNLSEFEGKIDFGYGLTSGSSDQNNKVTGVFNIPLVEDELALRVVGYRYDTAGYVDLVSTPGMEAFAAQTGTSVADKKDTAGSIFKGGRVTLLWQPNDAFSATLLYAKQKLDEDGYVDLSPQLGGYKRSQLELNSDPFKREDLEVVNLTMEYDFSWATLLASITDLDTVYNANAPRSFIAPWAAQTDDEIDKSGSVQEIRLTSHLDGDLQFVAGIFHEDYDRTRSFTHNWLGSQVSLENSGLGTNPIFGMGVENNEFKQKALFSELVYTFNPEWELTVGGRWFDYDRRDANNSIFAGNPTVSDLGTTENGTTYKANVTYSPDDDAMYYAQWAQGFRVGHGQALPPTVVCDVDGDGKLDFTEAPLNPRVDSDNTTNYELGAKFSFFDHRMALNTAVYRIDWNDIPVSVESTSPACGFRRVNVNAGEARLQGIEAEAIYYATPNLRLSLSVSYADNKYVKDTSIGKSGDRLPMSSTWVTSLGAEYNFEVAGYEAFVRSDYGYRDEFFQNNIGFIVLDGYGKLDMRAGIKLSKIDIEVYGTNLTGEDPLTTVWNASWGYRLPPRVVGMEARYEF